MAMASSADGVPHAAILLTIQHLSPAFLAAIVYLACPTHPAIQRHGLM